MNNDAKAKMQAAIDYLESDLHTVRTGRANAALVENLNVTYFDQQMPVKALANINTPDGKSITIMPWDPNATPAIEKALQENKELGLNPVSDGKAIHINVPPPTEERREQLVKQVSEKAEEAQIVLRNARHDALKSAQEQVKDKNMSEDEFERVKKDLDRLIADFGKQVEEMTAAKKKEVMEV